MLDTRRRLKNDLNMPAPAHQVSSCLWGLAATDLAGHEKQKLRGSYIAHSDRVGGSRHERNDFCPDFLTISEYGALVCLGPFCVHRTVHALCADDEHCALGVALALRRALEHEESRLLPANLESPLQVDNTRALCVRVCAGWWRHDPQKAPNVVRSQRSFWRTCALSRLQTSHGPRAFTLWLQERKLVSRSGR